MASNFRDRFAFNLTDSQSTMTIFRSQRSDSGTYELTVSPNDLDATGLKSVVTISVECKYIVYPYFLLETSTIILILIIIIIMIMNLRVMTFTRRLAFL